jgi:hypothetical protein
LLLINADERGLKETVSSCQCLEAEAAIATGDRSETHAKLG